LPRVNPPLSKYDGVCEDRLYDFQLKLCLKDMSISVENNPRGAPLAVESGPGLKFPDGIGVKALMMKMGIDESSWQVLAGSIMTTRPQV
jgi:hypothetical protein